MPPYDAAGAIRRSSSCDISVRVMEPSDTNDRICCSVSELRLVELLLEDADAVDVPDVYVVETAASSSVESVSTGVVLLAAGGGGATAEAPAEEDCAAVESSPEEEALSLFADLDACICAYAVFAWSEIFTS